MKRLFLFFIAVFTVVASVATVFVVPRTAEAADEDQITISWVNYAKVNLTHTFGDTFEEIYSGLDKLKGEYKLARVDQRDFYFTKVVDGCTSEIQISRSGAFFAEPSDVKNVAFKVPDPQGGGDCKRKQVGGAQTRDTANSKIMFKWVNSEKIQPVGKLPYLQNKNAGNFSIRNYQFFVLNPSLGYFQETRTEGCKSEIKNISGNKTSATFYAWSGKESGTCDDDYSDIEGAVITDTENAKKPPSDDSAADPEASNNLEDPGSESPSCESFFGGEILNWIVCPVINSLNFVIRNFDNAIFNSLRVNETDFDKEGTAGSSYYQIWSVMRYLAMAFVVVAALVMIISQAVGEGPFDAYSIKKIMPRLLAAVIGVSLSWELVNILISLTNNLGFGIRALIYTPFGGASAVEAPFVLSNGESFLSSSGLLIGGAVVGIGLGLFGLLSLAATAALAVIIAFAVIIFRKILITLLVISAPIAIIAFILPNTEKLWKLWRETLSKSLLMFPLIMALLASGRVFSKVSEIRDSSGELTLLSQVVSILAYYGPYFLIPATFKFAGGVIGAVGGIANDRKRGVFDRLSKGRQELRKDRFQRARNEKLWNPESRFTTGRFGTNKMASRLIAPHKNLAYAARNTKIPILGTTGRRLASSVEESSLEQSKKLFQIMNESGANDKTYRVLGGMHDGLSEPTKARLRSEGLFGKVLSSEQDITKAANIMQQSESPTEQIASNALRGLAPRISSLYKNGELNYANVGAASVLGLAAHGFAGGEDLAQAGNALASVTSPEFAQGALVQAQLAGARSRPDIKAGYGFVLRDGKFVDGMSDEGGRAEDLLKTISQGDIVQAKGGFLLKMGKPIKNAITNGMSESAVQAAQKYSTLSEEEVKALENTAEGKQLLKQAYQHRMALALKDELILAASTYSQSPVDTKAQANRLIDELRIRDELNQRENLLAAQQRLGQSPGLGEEQPPPIEPPKSP